MRLTDEALEKFKKLCEKEGIKYDSEDKYRESAQNLLNLAELSYEMAKQKHLWETRLKEEPKGFAIKGEGRTCSLCRHMIYEDMWYDKWGLKCLDCQSALDKKIIPGYVFADDKNERHITASTLSWRLDVRTTTIRRLVRQEKLKARAVPSQHGETLVFLRNENPDLAQIIEDDIRARSSAKDHQKHPNSSN